MVVDEVVKEVTSVKMLVKVVEEVNKKLAKEVNEGLVLIFRYGDGRRGYRKVGYGDGDDVVLDMEADVEVNQEVDKEVGNVVNE